MKKMMILVSTIMMVAASSNAKGVVETKPFEGVNVNIPARVRFVNGENYEMGVRSTDSLAAENVLWSVDNGVLNIRSRVQNPEEQSAELCITIVAPVEPKLTVGRNYEISSKKGKMKTETSK